MINPFEISKSVKEIIKNKNNYEKKLTEVKNQPLAAFDGDTKVCFDIEQHKIAKIEHPAIDSEILESITRAVNKAHYRSESFWDED